MICSNTPFYQAIHKLYQASLITCKRSSRSSASFSQVSSQALVYSWPQDISSWLFFSRTGFDELHWEPMVVSGNHFIETYLYSFAYVWSVVAPMLQSRDEVSTEIIQPTKHKIFMIWPFTENTLSRLWVVLDLCPAASGETRCTASRLSYTGAKMATQLSLFQLPTQGSPDSHVSFHLITL